MNRVRNIRAGSRAFWAALRRVRRSAGLLAAVLLTGTLLFWSSGDQPDLMHGLFYTLNLVTLNAGPDALPRQTLQGAALALTLLGLLAIGGGAANLINYIRDPKQLQMALASTYSNHVIVCGIGRVGYRVINELHALGDHVVAVNRDENEDWIADFKKAGVPVIIGDARRRATLVEAGITRAASLVVCTSDDLTNLDVALDARELNPEIKVVMRMFDQPLAEKIKGTFGLQSVFSVSALAAPALAAAATRTNVNYSFKLDDALMNVVTVAIAPDSSHAGHTIGQLEDASNCSVIGLNTGKGMAMHPSHAHVLKAGDVIHVVGLLEGVRTLL